MIDLLSLVIGIIGGVVAAIFLVVDFKSGRTYLILPGGEDEPTRKLAVSGRQSPRLFLLITLGAAGSALFALAVALGLLAGGLAETDFFAAVDPWLKTLAWFPFGAVVVYDSMAVAARLFDLDEKGDEIQTLGLD
jgi:hypothetical protein